MKKITLLVLLTTTLCFAQSSTFVKKYNSYVIEKNNIKESRKYGEVTVVFNNNEQKEIVFYYASGSIKKYYQITEIKEGNTANGDGFQVVDCVDSITGKIVALQLFDDGTCLRLFISSTIFIEMHND